MEALIGVMVGFALKAIYDLLTENRRWRREDRLRFIDRKVGIYADAASVSIRAHEALTKLRDQKEKIEQFSQLLEDGDTPPATLNREIESIKSTGDYLAVRFETDQADLSRVLGVLMIVAPPDVEEAARRMFGEAGTGGSRMGFADAHRAFRELAARDVGTRRSAHRRYRRRNIPSDPGKPSVAQ